MQPVKYRAILVGMMVVISLLTACGSPVTLAPTDVPLKPTIVLPTATAAPPTATAIPMLKPGDQIGQMIVKAGPPESDGPPLWAFCSPAFSTEPGVKTLPCTVPALPELDVGHGWFAVNESRRDSNWKAMKWELYIDNQRIDLDAFGAIDDDLPQKGLDDLDENKEVVTKLRTWVVLLSNLTLGPHTLRSVLHISQPIDNGFHANQPGTYELVLNMMVEAPPTPAPTPTLAPQAQVLLAWIDAFNAKDVDAFMALVADDAELDRGPYGIVKGKDKIRAALLLELKDNARAVISNLVVQGDQVTYSYVVYIGGRAVDRGNSIAIVKNGKIVSDLDK
jgi:hypothetical protein